MARLADLTFEEVRARLDQGPTIVLIPLGATEQHGPHLPLDTDIQVAVAVAAEVADGRDDVLVAPALAFGSSGEHAGFPGTLSIGQEALEQVLVELVRSADDFAGVVLVTGHGGNAGPLRRAVELLTSEGRRVAAWGPRIPGGDAHAGRTETSLMLAIAPETVRLDRAAAGNTEAITDLLPRLVAGGVAAVSANGVLGDPTAATAGEGAALLSALVTDLEATVSDLVDTL